MGTPMTYISGNTGAYQSGTFNKGTIALNLNPSSLASGNNWYNGVDVTATQYLIYSDTYSTGIATQANSRPTAWTTPDLSDTSLLNLINTLPDRIGVLPFTSLPLALQWLNATNEYFLIKTNFENIVTSGLVLNLDAGWYNSYSGTTTWFDRSGNGNNGTLINSPTFNGSSQGAIVFDGTDDYVDCGNLSTLNNLTVQMFVNVTSNTGNYRAFAAAKGGSQDYDSGFNIDMMLGSSTSFSNCNIEGGFLRIPGGTNFMQSSVPFGTWCNICFTVSPTYIQFYLNGVPQYGTARLNNASSTIGMNSLSIGRRPIVDSAVNSFINAKISNTQIYNRALSPQEVLQNYNAQKSRFGIYDIVQSGLTFNYSASNYLSYPRSGTTWYDMLSNSNNGTLINGPTFKTGSTPSIQFDGSNDYVQTDYSGIVGTNPRTLSIWFKPDVTQDKNLLGYGTASSQTMWDILLYQGNVGVHLYNSGAEAGTPYNVGEWQNITFTYTHPTIKSYMNGVYKNSHSNSSINTGSSVKLNLCKGGYDGYNYFDGEMSDVHIYNRELSPQEIVQNYEARRIAYGATGYTTSGLTLNLDAGNYASYPTTGTKWVDISGNYNNGNLINGPTWSSVTGGTFTFDGTDDYGSFSTNNLPSGNSEISFDCWVRWGGLFSTIYGEFVMGYGDDSGPNKVPVILINTSNQARFEFGSGSGAVISSSTISPNSWVNITATYNKSSTKIYLNGVLNGTTSYGSANIVPNGSNGYNGGIGTLFSQYGNKNSPSRYGSFSGNISSVRIYNVALSDAEILQNYNALKGRFGL
jgi:hypothetical protein